MPEYIKEKKSKLRDKYSKIRSDVMPKVEDSILNQVIKFLTKKEYKSLTKNQYIGIYWPLKGEVNLLDLKESLNVNFALPGIFNKGRVNYFPWHNNPLEKDLLGIPAPIKERTLSPSEIVLLLIPALAVDIKGFRLGYGGGYFDRLRSKPEWREVKSMLIVPNACISSTPLAKDHWDIPFKGWISEEGEYEIN